MSVNLDDLDRRFRPLVDRLLENAELDGIPLVVTYTLRSAAAQALAVSQGRSKTLKSKHLPQPPDGKSLAVDVCPQILIHTANYSPESPLWWRLGEIGRALGLRWGGQWNRPEPPPVGTPRYPTDQENEGFLWDPGHFELRVNGAPTS